MQQLKCSCFPFPSRPCLALQTLVMHPDRAPFALRTTLRSPLFASRWRTLKALAVSGALPASAGAVAGSGAGSGTSVGGAAAGRSRLSPQGMVGDSPASTVQQPGYGVLQRSRECGEADGGLRSVQQCSVLHMGSLLGGGVELVPQGTSTAGCPPSLHSLVCQRPHSLCVTTFAPSPPPTRHPPPSSRTPLPEL